MRQVGEYLSIKAYGVVCLEQEEFLVYSAPKMHWRLKYVMVVYYIHITYAGFKAGLKT